ncbi:type II toxin-antitoxin system antitoxin HipB [Pantoea sp.]|uniref:type II toxin-antitoxin system antitoxin HipB n=1 Tax=Pantoea sp. TaxID=69393 RepID=UPI0028A20499|nr:type II toxin-antitoxin system antitoxin HipB [Pantoea sp.]
MIYSPVQLANYLKLIRQQHGWTQSELANRVGLKQATISHFENSPHKTTLATLFKILHSLDQLMVIQAKNSADANPTNEHTDKELDW